mgnify:CR=1 FL=1
MPVPNAVRKDLNALLDVAWDDWVSGKAVSVFARVDDGREDKVNALLALRKIRLNTTPDGGTLRIELVRPER